MAEPPPPPPTAYARQSRSILIALLFPTIAVLLNASMFGVALPTIRDEFLMAPDVTAWLAIAFSLPFMMFMPLFGRLGDELGKSRLLLVGVFILTAGTVLIFVADQLAWVFVGRIIQGVGSASTTPLSLAILSERFSEEERGRAMGTWNMAAPGTSIFAPSISGFLVDNLGWRTILIPVLFLAIIAIVIVRWKVPSLKKVRNWSILRTFDWGGTLLLVGTLVFLVFYLSSRPITGVDPLRDWRLLFGFILFTGLFVWWERRQAEPLVDLHLVGIDRFRRASLVASFRMMMMTGIGFLLPLYLADLYDLNATRIGFVATIHSTVLFVAIWWGGQLSDRMPTENLIRFGALVQMCMMLVFALLPADLSLGVIIGVAIIHAAGAGTNLSSLHKTALGGVDAEKSGAAAGVYSMTRFAGSMLATAIAGVILQIVQDSGYSLLLSYQLTYGFLVLMGGVGLITALRLRQL